MQRPSGLAVGFSINFFDVRDLVLQQTLPIATTLSPQFTCPLRVVSVDHPVQAEMRPLNRLEERAPAKLKMLGDRAREGGVSGQVLLFSLSLFERHAGGAYDVSPPRALFIEEFRRRRDIHRRRLNAELQKLRLNVGL